MPSDRLLKTANRVHRLLVAVTGGRVGWRGSGMPLLELTTTGRTSGQPRSVMLASPIQTDGSYLVVASRGGDDVQPAWFLNLRANPDVEVRVRDAQHPMRARIVSPDERPALWARVVADFPHYGGYQSKTDREIPLVYLDPA